MRPRGSFALAAAVLALAALVTTASPATAADVHPNVTALPVGAAPQLPYVDWSARVIVDGSRRVSIAGIQGTVTALHKVDGGYVLGRTFTGGNDLVLVTPTGVRTVLVAHWMRPSPSLLYTGVKVSNDGSRMVVNVAPTGQPYEYLETRVVALPSGTVLGHHVFTLRPELLGYGRDRVLLSTYPATWWWTPTTDELELVTANGVGESADLSSWQWAVRGPTYTVKSLGSAPTPNWDVSQEDWRLGPWSSDGTAVAGNNEVTDDHGEASAYLVFRASDGTMLLSVTTNAATRITWETDHRLLLLVRIEGTTRYQLIRCALAGNCSKVGPTSTSPYGAYIPASRR